MFTFEQITELIELVSKHHLAGVEVEKSGFRLKIEGQPGVTMLAPSALESGALPHTPAPSSTPRSISLASSGGNTASPAEPPATAPVGHIIHSPIVGTFYRAPNPEAPSFVEVGSRVSKGQVLCIVEAMKLMNEIESDLDGVIAEIFPQNGQPVEYGEPLFAFRTA